MKEKNRRFAGLTEVIAAIASDPVLVVPAIVIVVAAILLAAATVMFWR